MTGSSANIQSYMNQALTQSGYSGVSTSVSGALATATYDGEDHVIGNTLGPDAFIINNGFGIGASASNSFTLSFTGLTVTALSFDWEIFPNADCAWGSYCSTHPSSSNWPDLTVRVNGVDVYHVVATLPQWGADPQAIGTSGLITLTNFAGLSGGGNILQFIDWPAEIGIDNLHIVTRCATTNPNCDREPPVSQLVPEPSSLPLLGAALAASLWVGARRRKSIV